MTTQSNVRTAAKKGNVHQYIYAAKAAVSEGFDRAIVEHDLRAITKKFFEKAPPPSNLSLFRVLRDIAYGQRARLYRPFCEGIQMGIEAGFLNGSGRFDRHTGWADFFSEYGSLVNQDHFLSGAMKRALETALPRISGLKGKDPQLIEDATKIVTSLGKIDCIAMSIDPDLIGSIVVDNLNLYPANNIGAAEPITRLRESSPRFGEIVGEVETRVGVHFVYAEGQIKSEAGWKGQEDVALAIRYNRVANNVYIYRITDQGFNSRTQRNVFETELVHPYLDSPYADIILKLLDEQRPSTLPWVSPLAAQVEQRLFSSTLPMP